LDEVRLVIKGHVYWLWRAVDQNGYELDILLQPRRNTKCAVRFLAVFGQVRNLFFLGRYKTAANDYRLKFTEAFQQWNAFTLQAYCV
jgi:hypothetical protein